MGTDSNEMFHISTARSALPIINISHDAGLNLSAEISRRIILNKSFSEKLIKRILGLNKQYRQSFQREIYSESKTKHLFLLLLISDSVCRFKSLSYYRHLTASPSFRKADIFGVACRRRQLSALQTMELPLDGDKYV